MSDTYETWIYPKQFIAGQEMILLPFNESRAVVKVTGVGVRGERPIALVVSVVFPEDEEQPQVAAPEPVQEELDQDIPLDFDLTEAGFRGLPPGVDAGEQEVKESAWRAFLDSRDRPFIQLGQAMSRLANAAACGDFDGYNPPVIPADAEGAPIAGTAEDAKFFFDALDARLAELAESPPAISAANLLPGVDEPVESWAAEAEAKRWRGDMLRILASCNICGIRCPKDAPTCRDCMGTVFAAYWRHGTRAAWDCALREHPAWGVQRF